MSIEIRNVNKQFGNFHALRDVSLDIASGELLALLGPSGCGKTTLLRIIAGLEAPDSGSIHFSGADTTDVHVRERKVGFVFQHYALFRHMTVFENVAFGLRMKPRSERPSEAQIKKKVHDLLSLVQLDWLAERHPAQLSGGQRQRIALARALAVEPQVLLLDEPFGVGPDALRAANPRLIMLRISGYGQTGPYRDRPGFGVVAEAMSGLRHLTGEPGRVPVRVGVSIGDTLAALHGVIGVLMALHHRNQHGAGQVIDVALYEAVFNCMESLLPEYSAFCAVRGPAGSALPGIAPSNAYRCKDGYALIAGNGDSIFKRLMTAIGRLDLANDPALASNTGRVARVAEIDQAIGQWAGNLTVAEALAALECAAVPSGKIYTIADIAGDPHYAARGMLEQIRMTDGTALAVPGFVPKLSATPGGHRHNAPTVGQDTDAVLRELGLSEAQIAGLRQRGVVA